MISTMSSDSKSCKYCLKADLFLRLGLEWDLGDSDKVRGLVGMVTASVSGWLIHYAYESPLKDRCTRVCMCVRWCGDIKSEYWQQRGVRMSNEKATLAAAAVPYPGLQGELVVLVEEKMCN